jgi:hypothetical protein
MMCWQHCCHWEIRLGLRQCCWGDDGSGVVHRCGGRDRVEGGKGVSSFGRSWRANKYNWVCGATYAIGLALHKDTWSVASDQTSPTHLVAAGTATRVLSQILC